jgi:hypothetical protein
MGNTTPLTILSGDTSGCSLTYCNDIIIKTCDTCNGDTLDFDECIGCDGIICSICDVNHYSECVLKRYELCNVEYSSHILKMDTQTVKIKIALIF